MGKWFGDIWSEIVAAGVLAAMISIITQTTKDYAQNPKTEVRRYQP